ncbi:DNA helicase II [Sinimarinibacterium sp. NLF-5-8]|uniref:DNA helicase II n=1 Tax=Sinimarinibacterium sp. NLF-5-8 TaxID=2698684 RepID=UPI00137BD0F9|nr:DNA helicase II [Sinimarinibacterium sp. NLF-5-8]QHS10642.1 DNA helicase II [Sinimarinibacterium sp. NLF-5-8]
MFEPVVDIAPLVAALNPAQRAAVTAPLEHRLVLAGAGSGKTRVLTHRIAYLIAAEGVSPLSILAVTFTNKAAAEMRARIEQLIDVPIRAMWVGTFHGIAHRMLRMHFREAGLIQNFQILDADDQQRLVKRIIKGLDLADEQWPAKTVTGWINAQKEQARRPEQISDQGDYNQNQLVRIYSAYQAACERQGVVDFAELLLRAYELCRDNRDIQAHYQRRFRHLLIDEFQDTNTLQYRWLRVLAGASGVLFAVGDDDQSVYSWRGARVEHMLALSRDFVGCEVVRLEQNYRSTGTILKAANGLIAKNSGRLGKNLWTDGSDGEPIQLYAAYNEYDEAEFVVSRIKAQVGSGARYDENAVLYRMGAQSRVLEEMLIRARLPYRIYGGLRFFERQEIKDALAYLRLLHNRDDDSGFERVVNTPARGIGATTVERLRGFARAQGISLWQAAQIADEALGRSASKVKAFCALIETMAARAQDQLLSKITEDVIVHSGLREHYGKEKSEQAEARLENLDELISATRAFELSALEAPIEGAPELDPLTHFLTHAALESGEQQAAPGEDCVQLMTLHAAKGLEFRFVFLVGMENGIFPHARAVDEGNLEEERRLCYVGITRARQQLYMSYAELRRLHGIEQIGMPSQFLRELPPETLQELRPRVNVSRPAFAAAGSAEVGAARAWRNASDAPERTHLPGNMRAQEAAGFGFALGARVRHERFGEGTVLQFEGDGERTRIQIKFAQTGTKWLMLSMANLVAV